jgi:predicted flavoprotein YhiN
MNSKTIVAIIGAGPAGLMAAQAISQNNNFEVHVFDAMPSVGRKFLLAGLGGLNITHAENVDQFLIRYQSSQNNATTVLVDSLKNFDSQAVIDWVHSLGIKTFIGSSGRVFPEQMKAAPLLRAWLLKLRAQGVLFHSRHRLTQIEKTESQLSSCELPRRS